MSPGRNWPCFSSNFPILPARASHRGRRIPWLAWSSSGLRHPRFTPHRASIISPFRERSRCSIRASRVSGGRAHRHSASDSVLVFQGTPPARDEDIVRPASASVHPAGAGQHDGPGPALKGPASGAIGERAWRHATQLALVSLKPYCGSQRFPASPGTCWRCIVPAVAPWHLRPSGFSVIREPFRQTALPPGSCLFVFALTKYEDGSA